MTSNQGGSSSGPVDRPIMAKLREIVNNNPSGGWDKAWQEDVTPWDFGDVQPPLRDLILSKEIDLPHSGRALVPGCGRGYDAVFIASTLGLETLAVDISPTALQAANDFLETSADEARQKVTFKELDFFSFSVNKEDQFDLVYDYLFYVAIPPSLRDKWGQKMMELVKPGGYLITLVYPLDPPTDLGPPFFVRPEHYVQSLGPTWDKVFDEKPKISSETHWERERMVVWRKAPDGELAR